MGHAELLCAALSLPALVLYLTAVDHRHAGGLTAGATWAMAASAVALAWLSALSKEIGITIVGTMAVYDLLLVPLGSGGRGGGGGWRAAAGDAKWGRIVVLGLAGVLYVKLRGWVAVDQLVRIYRKVSGRPLPSPACVLNKDISSGADRLMPTVPVNLAALSGLVVSEPSGGLCCIDSAWPLAVSFGGSCKCGSVYVNVAAVHTAAWRAVRPPGAIPRLHLRRNNPHIHPSAHSAHTHHLNHASFLSVPSAHATLAWRTQVENPIPFAASPTTRALSTLHLHARYFGLLLWPRHLSADWSYACIPLLESLHDRRVALPAALYTYLLASALAARPWGVVAGWLQGQGAGE